MKNIHIWLEIKQYKYFKIPQSIYKYFDVRQSTQKYLKVPINTSKCREGPQSTQKYHKESTSKYLETPKSTQKYIEVPRNTYKYLKLPDVPQSTFKYQECLAILANRNLQNVLKNTSISGKDDPKTGLKQNELIMLRNLHLEGPAGYPGYI